MSDREDCQKKVAFELSPYKSQTWPLSPEWRQAVGRLNFDGTQIYSDNISN